MGVPATPALTDAELAALKALRTRYGGDSGGFDDRELAHLRFLRWLVQADCLTL
jgi:hypothetical protein